MNEGKSARRRIVPARNGAPVRGSATPGGWCASNLILAMMAALFAAVVALEFITG
ncbi:hypothetical protein [Agrobacterium pusense]|jgi:hypothetical protein|uniref:Uncharacterized protein n=1 Tax=Agrobacterium pusense TaxID=648995 RepID=U4PZY3_9HYPH|nr:hypothetical protein [Agrobacterium pusense]MBW9078894.1 hypothetical protein [Agrobacterium pusense]MCJ2874684.1 hypothetical protein [Agrobacterium pusense]MDH0116610.1 hypothetical protein [Agrobacterium pusense]MDR6191292.1 hypothetical protein [Agrobacterium pusense]NRF09490.1 hypothetical protein [Agrobacterium pusense]